MYYLLAVITPSYKIILFGFIYFCSNAFAEFNEKDTISIHKHQHKRSIDFPTLFYPGPDNKFITLSPPPTLQDELTIFVNGQKETQKETHSEMTTLTKQKKTKFKVVTLHQDHKLISKPQIHSNSNWNQKTFVTKIPLVVNDQRPVQESLEWNSQKVPLNPTITTVLTRQPGGSQGNHVSKKNFPKIPSVPPLPFNLKSFNQIRGTLMIPSSIPNGQIHPRSFVQSPINETLKGGPPPSTPNGQVHTTNFIQFPTITVPRTLKSEISEPIFHSIGPKSDPHFQHPPPNHIVVHHQSTFVRSNYGVSTSKPLINQRPNHSKGNNVENKGVSPSPPPKTSFSCDHLAPGYYADLETRCKVFHVCNHGRRHTFVCPSETLFNQQLSVCDWPQRVTCPPPVPPSLYL